MFAAPHFRLTDSVYGDLTITSDLLPYRQPDVSCSTPRRNIEADRYD